MKDGTSYEQRDVVLLPFPFTDLTKNKLRPVLILSNHKMNKSNDRICCLITSNPHLNGINLLDEDFEDNCLPFASRVRPQRLFTADKKIIRKKITKVTEEFHKKILEELIRYIASPTNF